MASYGDNSYTQYPDFLLRYLHNVDAHLNSDMTWESTAKQVTPGFPSGDDLILFEMDQMLQPATLQPSLIGSTMPIAPAHYQPQGAAQWDSQDSLYPHHSGNPTAITVDDINSPASSLGISTPPDYSGVWPGEYCSDTNQIMYVDPSVTFQPYEGESPPFANSREQQGVALGSDHIPHFQRPPYQVAQVPHPSLQTAGPIPTNAIGSYADSPKSISSLGSYDDHPYSPPHSRHAPSISSNCNIEDVPIATPSVDMAIFTPDQHNAAIEALNFQLSNPDATIPSNFLGPPLIHANGGKGYCLIGDCRFESPQHWREGSKIATPRRLDHCYDHIRVKHFNSKPFACGCGQRFTRENDLKRHANTHTRPSMKCGINGCALTYTRIDNLRRHQGSKHDSKHKDD